MAFRFACDVAILPRVGFPFAPPARGAAAHPLVFLASAGIFRGRHHTWQHQALIMEHLACRGVVDEAG
jgi:hypothetical protein